MQSFIPAEWLTPANASQIDGPAILFSTTDSGDTLLIGGKRPYAIAFSLAGQLKHQAFKTNGVSQFFGLAVTDIKFEVLVDSSLANVSSNMEYGSLVRTGEVLLIQNRSEGRFDQGVGRPPLLSGLPSNEVWDNPSFNNWRCYKMNGTEKVILWEHDATKREAESR